MSACDGIWTVSVTATVRHVMVQRNEPHWKQFDDGFFSLSGRGKRERDRENSFGFSFSFTLYFDGDC